MGRLLSLVAALDLRLVQVLLCAPRQLLLGRLFRDVAISTAAGMETAGAALLPPAASARVGRDSSDCGRLRLAAGDGPVAHGRARAGARLGRDVARAAAARREDGVGLAATALGDERVLQGVLLRLVDGGAGGVARGRADVARAAAAGVRRLGSA